MKARVYVAIFEHRFSKRTTRKFLNFDDTLENLTALEMKGLGTRGSKKFKQTSSNKGTTYVLKDGGVIMKYGQRFNLVHKSYSNLLEILDSLRIPKDEREIKIVYL